MTIIAKDHTTQKTALERALDKLSASKHSFYLTGSRFFGTSHSDSDWDFFCQNTQEIIEWLSANGYTALPLKTGVQKRGLYADDNCALVYEHVNFPIHIQLQTNVTKKIMAQNIIMGLFPWLKIGLKNEPEYATSRREIWNAVYRSI